MNRQQPGDLRRIELSKPAHRWTFTLRTGDEASLKKALVELVERSEGSFDWFDAAVVCLELDP